MIYDYSQLNETEKRFIVYALTGISRDNFDKTDFNAFDVTLTINGTKVDFIDFCHKFWRQIEDLAITQGIIYMQDRLSKYHAFLSQLEECMVREIKDHGEPNARNW